VDHAWHRWGILTRKVDTSWGAQIAKLTTRRFIWGGRESGLTARHKASNKVTNVAKQIVLVSLKNGAHRKVAGVEVWVCAL